MRNVVFKPKPKSPADLVRRTRDLLLHVDGLHSPGGLKRDEKMNELNKLLEQMKSTLYGDNESEPVLEACAQLTQEFFGMDALRLLITCLPKLSLEARKDATQVVANLQKQRVNSRLISSDYLEANLDLLVLLLSGYEDLDLALHYGEMLRECIRHQSIARHVLELEPVKKFFDYMRLPNFDVAADAKATFKFFKEYNSKLLESENYITKRLGVKLLGDILLSRANASVTARYVSSKDNLRILMNLLRDSSKSLQLDAFHVFKLFVTNENKPPEVVSILVANRTKILRFVGDFKVDKEDEQLAADKALAVREISEMEPTDCPQLSLDRCIALNNEGV